MRACLKQFSLTALLLCSGAHASLYATEPYDSVRLLTQEPYFFENGYILLDKVNTTGTTLFIDVDSPKGEASRFIASYNTAVTVLAVNSWYEESAYHRFLSNVRQEGTDGRITPLRMCSSEASNALDVQAGVIFLDSSRSETLYEKIPMWLTQLGENGVIAGNHWQSNSVEVAVVNAAAQLNLILSINGNYWFLTRP